ncbi:MULTISPECIES: cation diffusion facilitator family transporter [Priestia]|uniref:Cation diffusion facilitator family transporter n=4 Tax=Bacillaceae TaxID=186817 RepID=A0AAX6BPG2_PRIMG|nr:MULTISPECIES: cation diffusion facilitator family transporter [Priestia]MBK0295331.1 cation transporter [Bacillus sp. S34]MCL9636301.1 cation diffusion facilitator family transporter [Bacillus zanthoxyli]NHH92660.1 putative cation efflux system protein [Bacillus sp. MB95]UPK51146.1 cation diffusion facilitator family transporter [Bacillus sp. H8-1]AKP79097.1 putative cation efflux system protein [Priestia megaterium Q3]
MSELIKLLRKGNKSAMMAAIVNTIISIIKGIAFALTGNVAMFAETMHSLGDAANQFFVFIGSALSKKAPTKRFPNGFGRLVNLVLLGAVLVVGIMAFETIKEGYHHILHPTKSSGFILNIAVLGISVLLEMFVLFKAMKEILHDVGMNTAEVNVFTQSFVHLKKAKPATKLVFMEDLVATGGGVLALIAVFISRFTPFHQAEGIASMLIGLMMFFVVGRVFLDNAAGALGEADKEMEMKIGAIVMQDVQVRDIQTLMVMKEGEELHVELKVEIDPSLTVAEADDIKDRLENRILQEKGITDVIIEFDEDDGIPDWVTSDLQLQKE